MIVLRHNPDCSTSRTLRAVIEAAANAPGMIPYLEIGWRRPQLLGLLAAADLSPRAARRAGKSPAEALGLLDPAVPGAALIDAMRGRPILVDRPRFCAPKGVRLCRPSDAGAPSLVAISWIDGPMALSPRSMARGSSTLCATG